MLQFKDLEIGDSFRVLGTNDQYLRIAANTAQGTDGGTLSPDPETNVELIDARTSTRVPFKRLAIGELFTFPARPGQVYARSAHEVATNQASGDTRVFYSNEPVQTLEARAGLPLSGVSYALPDAIVEALKTRDIKKIQTLHESLLARKLINFAGVVRLVGELIEYVDKLEHDDKKMREARDLLVEIGAFAHKIIYKTATAESLI